MIDCQYEAQAHILNMPLGHKIPTSAKDSVKLEGVVVKLAEKKARWRSLVGFFIILSIRCSQRSYSQLMNVALPGLLALLVIVFFVVFLVTSQTPAGSNKPSMDGCSTRVLKVGWMIGWKSRWGEI